MPLPAESEQCFGRYKSGDAAKANFWKDRDIYSSSAGSAYSGKPSQYVSPSSKNVTEVEYTTKWYSESQGRPSLSPATKKHYRDQVEADMAEMSSLSESEIRAVIE